VALRAGAKNALATSSELSITVISIAKFVSQGQKWWIFLCALSKAGRCHVAVSDGKDWSSEGDETAVGLGNDTPQCGKKCCVLQTFRVESRQSSKMPGTLIMHWYCDHVRPLSSM